MLCLSDRQLRDLQSFIEVVSTPLGYPDSASWRRDVNSRGRNLLDAQRAVFALEWDRSNPIEEDGQDPAALPAYLDYYHLLDTSHHERRRRNRAVFGRCLQLAEGWKIGTEFVHDFLERFRLDRGCGMAYDVAPDVAGWCGFYSDAEPREEFESRALAILELAYPAFRAGLESVFRTAGLRGELIRLLDIVSDGFLLVASGGRILHQNLALARIRRADPEWNRLEQALDAATARFCASARDLEGTIGLFRGMPVITQHATYEVIPTIPGPDLMQLGVRLLVQVVTKTAAVPSCEMLCERFALTVREAEVTRCLAQGMSYKAAAERLNISIDTVRSHIRSIYSKLQVQSVTEAVSRTLRESM